LEALWTLYTSFAYILCFIILFLVVGWKNLSALEYTAVAGSPVIIYLIRMAITTYYNFRVDTVMQRLEEQQAERAKTIDKLKAATKYNSTQEILEKYGDLPPQPSLKPKKQDSPSRTPRNTPKQLQRTGMGPPATANISRPNQIPSQPSTPQTISNRTPPPFIAPPPINSQDQPGPPEFAPNAFLSPPQYSHNVESNPGGNWYDRILDLLLGEDETLPKNRVALICQRCRLVNGQAPPGTKSLADIGRWRCFGCGGWNGEEDEGTKVVKQIKERMAEQSADSSLPTSEDKAGGDQGVVVSGDERGDGHDKETADEDEEETVLSEYYGETNPKKGLRPKGTHKKA